MSLYSMKYIIIPYGKEWKFKQIIYESRMILECPKELEIPNDSEFL